MITGYQRQRRVRLPEARLRVSQAGSGAQDLSTLGPLAQVRESTLVDKYSLYASKAIAGIYPLPSSDWSVL
eukprot:5642433-Pyramimonas_sp.AAC.1